MDKCIAVIEGRVRTAKPKTGSGKTIHSLSAASTREIQDGRVQLWATLCAERVYGGGGGGEGLDQGIVGRQRCHLRVCGSF